MKKQRARRESRAIIAHHSKSFALASKLLPGRVREDAVILYAWCRACDDAVDNAATKNEAREAIARLRNELELIYSGSEIDDPILSAFQDVIFRCGIPQKYPTNLLDGMESDVCHIFYPDEEALLQYCYQAAGTVGLMMSHVLGISDDRALPHAAALGMAMQLTNIARDIWEDWQRGRCYVPAQWVGVEAITNLSQIADSDALKKLLTLADAYYCKGEDGFQYLSDDCVVAIDVAKCVYASIGEKIKARNYRLTGQRAYVSRWQKIWIAGSTILNRTLFQPRSRRVTRIPTAVWNYPGYSTAGSL